MKKFIAFILEQLNKTTAWVGIIGITLQLLGLQSVMFVLFILLIVLPESNFSSTFKEWTERLRKELDSK